MFGVSVFSLMGKCVGSVSQAEITGSEDTYGAAAPVIQWCGAKIIPSAQPEKAEHEQDDDDGSDEPDDSVHDGLLCWRGLIQARLAGAHRNGPA
ncbi:hypothetical protein [Piscinibacter sp.]|uniref:hypothetical protein n=1 Tax=Piscinibacter sp. TaxID=1903157 RepID=UPI002CD68BE1|nr:hypothetical protein [Albitalea sp.]HUG21766.1 hypothetical protein [Albitalea sp.]